MFSNHFLKIIKNMLKKYVDDEKLLEFETNMWLYSQLISTWCIICLHPHLKLTDMIILTSNTQEDTKAMYGNFRQAWIN